MKSKCENIDKENLLKRLMAGDGKYWAISIVVATAVSLIMYDTLKATLILLPFSIYIKKFYDDHKRESERRAILDEFKDFLYLATTSFSLGYNMRRTIEEAEISLRSIYGDKSRLSDEFAHMIFAIKNTNENEVKMLEALGEKYELEDIKDFTRVYKITKETGTNMIVALSNAASIIADKIAIENEIKTSVYQRKLEGRIISAMPFMIVLFLKLTSPDYVSVLYNTLAGRGIMTISIILVAVSIYMVEKYTTVRL